MTRDVYGAPDKAGGTVLHEASGVVICDGETDRPHVTFHHQAAERRIDCAHVAGRDGFQGVSRRSILERIRKDYKHIHPLGWLGILSETRPAHHEFIYAGHERGFALCSMRNAMLSRYYL